MKKAFTLFLCLLCVALLCLSPAILLEGIHKNVYTLLEQEQQQKYSGNLTLWHVVSFKTGGESGVSYLRSRIRAFERSNPYVFIQLTAYTVEEAQAAMAEGQFPDILSFPLGFISDPALLSPLAEQDAITKPFRNVGRRGNTLYAYPYMADFYALCCDQDALFYQDISLPLDTVLDTATLGELTDALAKTDPPLLATGSTSMPLAAASFLFTKSDTLSKEQLQFWQSCPPAQSAQFWNKEASLLLCPAGEASKAQSQNLADAISLQTYAFSRFTDLCQLVGIRADMEDAKQQMCERFAASLLNTSAQKGLTGLYMLPVTEQEGLYEDAPFYAQEYAALIKSALVPNNFTYPTLQTPIIDQETDIDDLQKKLQLGK